MYGNGIHLVLSALCDNECSKHKACEILDSGRIPVLIVNRI